jgi:hypothetical protein
MSALVALISEDRKMTATRTKLALVLMLLGCLGGMLVMMPDTVAALPFRDRMWSYGLGFILFLMGFFAAP